MEKYLTFSQTDSQKIILGEYNGRVMLVVKCPLCKKKRSTQRSAITRSKHTYCRGCARTHDLRGYEFGRLTVISFDIKSKKWTCRCSCGKNTKVKAMSLRNGDTKSCGCLERESRVGTNSGSYKPLVGKRFGKLVVKKYTKNNKRLCKCDCGNTVEISGRSLVNGHTKSCGCLPLGARGTDHYLYLDVTKEKFGRLTVIEYTSGGKRLCLCECGNTKEVYLRHLKEGHVKSCGCIRREMIGENHPSWRHDLSEEERSNKRTVKEYNKFISQVYSRDNYMCQVCGSSNPLNAHHLYDWSTYPEFRTDINNAITLCKTCHFDFHTRHMGHTMYSCTPLDYEQWLKELR